MPELATQYAPADVERRVARRWREARAFHAEPSDPGRPWSMLIPPPNVTAALHLGHALNNTLQDVLTRYHRMRGENAVWLPGTDHAGIATQTVVDKRLASEGEPTLKDYKVLEAAGEGGRARFLERVQAWKDEYEARITGQLIEMGCSCDFQRQRFTMDPVCARAVQEAFFRLFRDGLIYRGKRLVNWDPVTQTALADDEVEMKPVDGHFWYLKYPLVDEEGAETGSFVTVATTRPETMLGDTAVAVNPNDPERAGYAGRRVRVPIVNRIVPVIADDYVVVPDERGDEKARMASGFLKVTPAHDPNDWAIGERHGLAVLNIFGPDGTLSADHGWPEEDLARADPFLRDALLGQDRHAARRLLEQWFEAQGLLAGKQPHHHSVGHSYRSHAPIEPYLSDQWYVRVTDERLAGAALRAMAPEQRSASQGCTWKEAPGFEPAPQEDAPPGAWEGGLRFTPERYAKTFQVWHENIRDWCISRQLWWGHRIPVWHKRVMLTEDNWTDELLSWGWDSYVEGDGFEEEIVVRLVRVADGTEVDPANDPLMPVTASTQGEYDIFVCLREDQQGRSFEAHGFTRDPDVLDTWFSSALWPISTLGWPDPAAFPEAFPEGEAALETWNPSDTLCTAREIITLWVSRMVMFNIYFRGCLPFRDVFIHAMIQDGHGQKMSKSLGNGVDPSDIIHSHGADAMRFTLTAMTTHTQDVRLPVALVDPETGEQFEPAFVQSPAGYTVAAPIQERGGRRRVSSYGLASGEAVPDEATPLARNTSPKFDMGRNFANKLWNAARFALERLSDAPEVDLAEAPGEPGLLDRWMLSRLVRAVGEADRALARYEFNRYADTLYQVFRHELCDWYIEAVKPTIRNSRVQRRVLARALDVCLRLLHPSMPFITEALWEKLNELAPDRAESGGVQGLEVITVPHAPLLVCAPWPVVDATAGVDPEAESCFERVQALVQGIREVRTANQVPPKRCVDASIRALESRVAELAGAQALVEGLAGARVVSIGPDAACPAGAGRAACGEAEVFVHGVVDVAAERARLERRREEVEAHRQTLRKRLENPGYVNKAPAHLVQQTRDELAEAERELEALAAELEGLG